MTKLYPSIIPDGTDEMTREYLDELTYNELRTHAKAVDVETPANPTSEELIDALEGCEMP